jgi:NADH-quinone oxidoreductase subunit G
MGDVKPDFAITAQVAEHMGLTLEGKSPAAIFEQIAASVPSFRELTYAKVSEVKPQWPIVGRGDMYYGGTTYENTMGLGAHLTAGAGAAPGEAAEVSRVRREPAHRPKDKELLAVPINRLYDRGTTVMMSADLLRDRIGSPTVLLHPETAKNLGLEAADVLNIRFDGVSGEAKLALNESVPTGVVLVPRDMGIAIREPVPAALTALEKVQ